MALCPFLNYFWKSSFETFLSHDNVRRLVHVQWDRHFCPLVIPRRVIRIVAYAKLYDKCGCAPFVKAFAVHPNVTPHEIHKPDSTIQNKVSNETKWVISTSLNSRAINNTLFALLLNELEFDRGGFFNNAWKSIRITDTISSAQDNARIYGCTVYKWQVQVQRRY